MVVEVLVEHSVFKGCANSANFQSNRSVSPGYRRIEIQLARNVCQLLGDVKVSVSYDYISYCVKWHFIRCLIRSIKLCKNSNKIRMCN